MGKSFILAGRIARGDVRLVDFPPPDKTRPVVVLTRDFAIQYLFAVTVVPVTSSIRGTPSEVLLTEADGMKSPCAANLDNITTVSQRRIGRKVAGVGEERMAEICRALGFATGCVR
jgi:mRNA interferase MazF